jgi:hypothetical protein
MFGRTSFPFSALKRLLSLYYRATKAEKHSNLGKKRSNLGKAEELGADRATYALWSLCTYNGECRRK